MERCEPDIDLTGLVEPNVPVERVAAEGPQVTDAVPVHAVVVSTARLHVQVLDELPAEAEAALSNGDGAKGQTGANRGKQGANRGKWEAR